MTADNTFRLRVIRTARRVPLGKEIMEFLQQPENVEAIIAMADTGEPPISAVSNLLINKFGKQFITLNGRQFVGMAVRLILQDAGYRSLDRGVRIKDPLFTTGSTYEKIPEPKKISALPLPNVNEEEKTLPFRLMKAMLAVMTREEKIMLARLVTRLLEW